MLIVLDGMIDVVGMISEWILAKEFANLPLSLAQVSGHCRVFSTYRLKGFILNGCRDL
jgi:hypothetical protein